MYPKQAPPPQSTPERAPFWAVLERTAALAEPPQGVKVPELIDLARDVPPTDGGDTRVVESDAQLPREVYAHIRGLLGDVETPVLPGTFSGQTPSEAPSLETDSVASGATIRQHADVAKQSTLETQGDHGGHDSGSSVDDPTLGSSLERTQLQETTQPADPMQDNGGVGPMYEFGAHATVIPGTEEFMSSLARKNRAFEHTGEIDTDLDRAADKLGWNRSDDDVVAKRKIFKKKKRS
ncbi:hypothetical protein [Ferrimicrobium sp.]|uniref:hypothetical protein n=1 Tax=Ferrimicrobium sp. TaxID=2926050 RepID=UPI00261D2C13|nr:hypothetical protein [Ferrimicrobium sp.]